MALVRLNNQSISSVTALPSGIDTGKVGQVVSTTIGADSWVSTTNTGSWQNFEDGTNNLEVTITPSATSSKIMLIINARTMIYRASAGNHAQIGTRILLNGTTALHAQNTGNDNGWYQYDNLNTYFTTNVGESYLHSPNSTSAQTYRFQQYFGGSQQFYFGRKWNTITALEVLA